MKKYLLFLLCIILFENIYSQVSIVKDVTSSLKPGNTNQTEYNNYIWNNKLFYVSSGTGKLSVTDGTSAGTIALSNLGGANSVSAIIPVQDFVYVFASTITYSGGFNTTVSLWKSNGTVSGTSLITNFPTVTGTITPVYFSTSLYKKNFSVSGNTIYFSGSNGTNGIELWTSDGTVAGTYQVADIQAGSSSSNPSGFVKTDTGNYFIAAESGYARKLYKTDGTSAGTLKIPVTEPFYIVNNDMAKLGNKMIFFAHNTVDGYEPYVSDGTAEGTFMLKNINSSGNSLPSAAQGLHLKVVGNYCYFMAYNGSVNSLWRTDGTSDGTIKLIDENNNISDSDYSTEEGNRFWYIAYNSAGSGANSKLIVTDGSVSGTSTVVSNLSYPQKLKIFKNSVWMQARNIGSSANAEIWRSDGFASNTNLAIDASGDTLGYSSNPYGFFELNGKLYFWGDYNFNNNHALFQYNPDYTFNGSVDNNWSNNNNWNSGLKPISGDNATIPTGYNINIDSNAFVNNLITSSPINLISENLNIFGNLNLGSKITLNNNNLNLKGGNSLITNGNSTNYIVTNGTGTANVENFDSSRGTVHLPIGTSTNYNPISITNSGTSDTYSARVSDGNSSTNPSINTTWEISEATSGGSNVNLSLGWNQSQENSGFNRTSAKVGHFIGGIWNAETSSSVTGSNPYQISATGITSFSPFSVMNFGTLGSVDFSKSKTQVFPNPFNENLKISTQENGVVYFYDLSGKLVSTSMLMKGPNSINKSSLANGVYIYQIKNKDGQVISSGKVIKK